MALVTFGGKMIKTSGDLPALGSRAPDFCLVDGQLGDRTLDNWARKVKILNIVPSFDTPVCATSVRRFNQEVEKEPMLVVLGISCDLPFAQSRFCQNEGIRNIIPLSQMRDRSFGRDYGVEIVDSPMAGLLSRAVVVLDRENTVVYTQQVADIGNPPDYAAALEAARAALAK
ncbi:thiol peroxidase [Treponema primitia ZAS-2]|uniref:Thiol peroxidase n=1 Tax=Treponema primitia (strain ATCC BAA-887 / DSM 12427 / ZAS-2) TaxID=545694 RepID=F5YHM7_TREPZ|nr:thiol peroxidase [Treponema primitia]AEF84860.1 thiol peroxidase [Treponema primitia ZAS-2]